MPRVIVTGANRGLGFATAEKLLRRGCAVVLTSRDPAAGEAAADALRAAVPSAQVEARQLDTSLRASIEGFARALWADGAPIDVLLNNAGRMNRDPQPAVDTALVAAGMELFFASNVLGPFLLTRMLLPLLLRAPAPRVVNVSSRTHLRLPKGSFPFDGSRSQSVLSACCRRARGARLRDDESPGTRPLMKQLAPPSEHRSTTTALRCAALDAARVVMASGLLHLRRGDGVQSRGAWRGRVRERGVHREVRRGPRWRRARQRGRS